MAYTTLTNDGGGGATVTGLTATLMTTLKGVRALQGKTTGKWYWEVKINTVGNDMMGFVQDGVTVNRTSGQIYIQTNNMFYYMTGTIFVNGASGTYTGATLTTGDVVGCALDIEGKTIKLYKNNALQTTVAFVMTGTVFYPAACNGTGSGAGSDTFNFGASALVYAPPAGYIAYDNVSKVLINDGGIAVANDTTVTNYNAIDGAKTLQYRTAGKWYWEFTINSAIQNMVGFIQDTASVNPVSGNVYDQTNTLMYYYDGTVYTNGIGGTYKGASFTTGVVMGVALDIEGKTVQFYKNSTLQVTVPFNFVGDNYYPAVCSGTGTAGGSVTFNIGDSAFAYSIPSGYTAFSSRDLTLTNDGGTATIEGYYASNVTTTKGARTIQYKTSGKWYWEFIASTMFSEMYGFVQEDATVNRSSGNIFSQTNSVFYYNQNTLYLNGSPSGTVGATFTTGDIVGIALDIDNHKIRFYKNGAFLLESSFTVTGTNYYPAITSGSATAGGVTLVNLGAYPFKGVIPYGYIAFDTTSAVPQKYERVTLDTMTIGDTISCDYYTPVANAGYLGAFSNLGTSTKTLISPTAPSGSPDGKFYFVYAGNDYNGRMKLIADRNIETFTSWDFLNNSGVTNGIDYPFSIGLNATGKASTVAISNKNLTFTDTAVDAVITTEGRSSGKWYWEVFCNSAVTISGEVGVANASFTKTTFLGSNANSLGYLTSGSKEVLNSTTTYGASWGVGDTVGVALDIDLGIIEFFKNGVSQGVLSSSIAGIGTPIYPAVCSGQTSGNPVFTLNLGGSPFSYPIPSGYQAFDYLSYNLMYSYAMNLRLMTGGVTASATANEWDKIVVGSTLQGKVIAGDTIFWNIPNNSTVTTWTTTQNASPTTRVWRGYNPSSSWLARTSSNVQVGDGFRPILIVEKTSTNHNPTSSSMAVDRTSSTTDPITLTGTIDDVDVGQQVQYQVMINSTLYSDWSALANPPVSINTVIPISNFNVGANTITVNFMDSTGAVGSSWVSSTITRVNSAPVYSSPVCPTTTHNSDVNISTTLTDADGNQIQYRILLNGSYHYPDNAGTFTSLANTPVSVTHTFTTSELSWGANTISVEFKDSLGTSGTAWSPTVSKVNTAPTASLSLSSGVAGTTHNTNVTVSGTITDPDGDTVKYRVLLNGVEHLAYNSLGTSPMSVSHTFLPSELNWGSNTIGIEYQDQYGLTTESWSDTVSKTNATPTNTLIVDRTTRHRETVHLTGNLVDSDGDTLQYRVSLGGSYYYPDTNGSWTALAGTGTLPVDITFTAPDFNATNKTILVEYQDQYGQRGTDYSQLITFTNATPVIDVNASALGVFDTGISLVGNITETTNIGDNVRYRITLNGTTVKSWTILATSPIAINEAYQKTDFSMGDNTLVIYAEDEFGASSNRSYLIRRRDWEVTYVNPTNPTTSYIGDNQVLFDSSNIMLIKTGDINSSKGYLKQALLTIKMKTLATGTVKMAKVNSTWSIDSVIYNNRPTIDTANAVDVTFINSAYQTIDVTSFAGSYGVAFYTTSGSFIIDSIGNSASITYYPTLMNQPEETYADGVTLTWQPVLFGDLHSEAFTNMNLVRSENSNFSSSTIVMQTSDSTLASYFDTTVAVAKNYFYKIQLQFSSYAGSDSTSIGLTTPVDLLHRMVWNGTTYDSSLAEGLMFHDEMPEFYTTNKGLVLKYLELPMLLAGNASDPVAIELENTFDTTATDILISSNVDDMPFGTAIKFSKTLTPFSNLDILTYTSLASMGTELFYMMITADSNSVGHGDFGIKVKGTITT